MSESKQELEWSVSNIAATQPSFYSRLCSPFHSCSSSCLAPCGPIGCHCSLVSIHSTLAILSSPPWLNLVGLIGSLTISSASIAISAALIFAVAPLPNFLCSRCVGDDFSTEYSSGPVDFGHFITSVLLVCGLALPTALAHSGVIHEMAGWMSAIGGVVGYLTSECLEDCAVTGSHVGLIVTLALAVITYSHFFAIQIESY